MNEMAVAVLLLAPTIGGLAAWRLRGRTVELVTLAAYWVSAAAGVGLALAVAHSGRIVAWRGVVAIDALGAYVLVLTLIVAGLALWASPRYIHHELVDEHLRPKDEGRYYALLLGFIATLMAVPIPPPMTTAVP